MDGGSWHCTGGSDQDHPQKKKCKEAKSLSEEGLQIAVKREVKGKGEKKDIPIWMESSKEYQGAIRKPSSVISAKK